MTVQTYDITQLNDLWTELRRLHLPLNALHVDRTTSNNLTATVYCAHHGDVQKWAKALGEGVYVADGEATCVGELAGMSCLVTTRAA